jgi:hypothetical protein
MELGRPGGKLGAIAVPLPLVGSPGGVPVGRSGMLGSETGMVPSIGMPGMLGRLVGKLGMFGAPLPSVGSAGMPGAPVGSAGMPGTAVGDAPSVGSPGMLGRPVGKLGMLGAPLPSPGNPGMLGKPIPSVGKLGMCDPGMFHVEVAAAWSPSCLLPLSFGEVPSARATARVAATKADRRKSTAMSGNQL